MSPFRSHFGSSSVGGATGYSLGQGQLARRFFAVSCGVFAVAGLLGWSLTQWLGSWTLGRSEAAFPLAFAVTSLLLVGASLLLQQALEAVKRERQPLFRRSLRRALLLGTLFVALQGYGLWCMLQRQDPQEASTGANAFIFVIAFLHALHVSVALLFLVFVTIRGHADRYDHEYYWGVTFCALFWHFLGVVWLAILFVFGVAA